MQVTRTTVWSDGNTLTASALNGEFNNLLNSPDIENADIASDAAIALTKLAGSDEGAIIYDNGSSLSALAPGTSGEFLQTQGAGMAPAWASLAPNVGSALDTTSPTLTGTPTQIGGLSVTLTTTGKPCLVVGQVSVFDNSISTPSAGYFQLMLDGSSVQVAYGYVWSTGVRRVYVYFAYISTPSAGSHTWAIQGSCPAAIVVDGSNGPNSLIVCELH